MPTASTTCWTTTKDNDPVYVPKDAGDITLADPADYPSARARSSRQEPCLPRQRGRLLERNSCRQPWISFLNARLTKVLPTGRGRRSSFRSTCSTPCTCSIPDWGVVRFTIHHFRTGPTGRVSLLELVGYDVAHGRGVYRVLEPQFRQVDSDGSRWRLRLSTRYVF